MAEKALSKKLMVLASVAALTGLASTAEAGESPSILAFVAGDQQHALSEEEMSKVTGTFFYTIKPGDTLIGISGRFRHEGKSIASSQEIYNARAPNGRSNRDIIGSNRNLIHPGQTIWVPDLPGNFPSFLRGKPL